MQIDATSTFLLLNQSYCTYFANFYAKWSKYIQKTSKLISCDADVST